MGRAVIHVVCAILVGVALAGCVHEPCAGERYTSAHWIEPGFFAALNDGSTKDPGERHGRLPFVHNETEALWGPDHALSMVTQILSIGNRTDDGQPRAFMRVVPASPPGSDLEHMGRYLGDLHATMITTHTITDAQWRVALASFAADTGIIVDDPEAWIETVLAARRPPYGATETTPLRIGYASLPEVTGLEALYDHLGGHEDEQSNNARWPGQRNLRWAIDSNETWWFEFRLGVRSVSLQGPDDLAQLMEVDAGDLVRVKLPPELGGNETAHQQWITKAFRAAGFDEPTFERFVMSAVPC